MAVVYIGIGSNLGNRKENCLSALTALSNHDILIKKQSSLNETEPWGVKGQPEFINMAVKVETDKTPGELLNLFKEIEKDMGRQETYKWGPRIIDLDILLYDSLVVEEPDLKIPHPLMHMREFVLTPLAEIAPEVVHPILKKTVKSLLDELEN